MAYANLNLPGNYDPNDGVDFLSLSSGRNLDDDVKVSYMTAGLMNDLAAQEHAAAAQAHRTLYAEYRKIERERAQHHRSKEAYHAYESDEHKKTTAREYASMAKTIRPDRLHDNQAMILLRECSSSFDTAVASILDARVSKTLAELCLSENSIEGEDLRRHHNEMVRLYYENVSELYQQAALANRAAGNAHLNAADAHKVAGRIELEARHRASARASAADADKYSDKSTKYLMKTYYDNIPPASGPYDVRIFNALIEKANKTNIYAIRAIGTARRSECTAAKKYRK